MHDLVVHLDRVNNAASVEVLWRLHLDAMMAFGFDRLLYGYTRYRTGRRVGDPQDLVVLSNLPPAYMHTYMEEGLYANAPMVLWALENEGACSWSWLAQRAVEVGFSSAEMRTLEFNRKLGITAGYPSASARYRNAPRAALAYALGPVWIRTRWTHSGRSTGPPSL